MSALSIGEIGLLIVPIAMALAALANLLVRAYSAAAARRTARQKQPRRQRGRHRLDEPPSRTKPTVRPSRPVQRNA